MEGAAGACCACRTQKAPLALSLCATRPWQPLVGTTYPVCLHSTGTCGCLPFHRALGRLRLGLLLPATCRSCPAHQTPAGGHSEHVSRQLSARQTPAIIWGTDKHHSCLPVPSCLSRHHCTAGVTPGTRCSSSQEHSVRARSEAALPCCGWSVGQQALPSLLQSPGGSQLLQWSGSPSHCHGIP